MVKGKTNEPRVLSNTVSGSFNHLHTDKPRRSAIDVEMIRLAMGLNKDADNAHFRDVLVDHSEALRGLLKKARMVLHEKKFESLEELAIEMSHNALRLGAKELLGSCIGLQNWSRCKAMAEAEEVLNAIEGEFALACEDLDNLAI